ncbi:hypothetical protein Acr_00g0026270 [Actinidia rufa]|uniref:Uncharacterized protein n=1 Tax=Actinidia rufa TaxID=165716 RepID=A0A7J0DE89_9ERIC|nr:hypothetical protein Acr_00g0026270 [Actinidia rufa]
MCLLLCKYSWRLVFNGLKKRVYMCNAASELPDRKLLLHSSKTVTYVEEETAVELAPQQQQLEVRRELGNVFLHCRAKRELGTSTAAAGVPPTEFYNPFIDVLAEGSVVGVRELIPLSRLKDVEGWKGNSTEPSCSVMDSE